jgi:hypothetical protein
LVKLICRKKKKKPGILGSGEEKEEIF